MLICIWNDAVCAHKGCMCLCVYHFQLAGSSPSNCGSEKPYTQSVGFLPGVRRHAEARPAISIATLQTTSNEQVKPNENVSRWSAGQWNLWQNVSNSIRPQLTKQTYLYEAIVPSSWRGLHVKYCHRQLGAFKYGKLFDCVFRIQDGLHTYLQ